MIDLFQISLSSTGKWVHSRIKSNEDQKAYMDTLTSILENSQRYEDVRVFREVLIKERYFFNHNCVYGLYFLSNPKKYTLLAYDHSLDIADSLTKRFHGWFG